MLDKKIDVGAKRVDNRPQNVATPLQVLMLCPDLRVNGGISSVINLILQAAPPDVNIDYLFTHIEGSLLLKIRVFSQAVGGLLWKLLSQRVDVVYIHMSQGGSTVRKSILVLIAALFQKPIVMHTHGSRFRQFYSNLPFVAQRLLSWIFRRCARFIVLSDSWKVFYTKTVGLSPTSVVVLSNPVKLPPHVPPRSASKQVTFLFLGRIGSRKGAFDLIRAYAAMPADLRDQAHLIVAGDGEVDAARQLVDSLGLTDAISLPGWVGVEQRDQLLAGADVFVLPSYNEGLPMSVLEAMGWGLPVITTPVGGIPELITPKQNGLLVTPGDLEQLATAMQFLIQDSSERQALGRRAREHVLPLDIHAYCVSLVDVYYAALKSSLEKT